jgi:hypothetical protein
VNHKLTRLAGCKDAVPDSMQEICGIRQGPGTKKHANLNIYDY